MEYSYNAYRSKKRHFLDFNRNVLPVTLINTLLGRIRLQLLFRELLMQFTADMRRKITQISMIKIFEFNDYKHISALKLNVILNSYTKTNPSINLISYRSSTKYSELSPSVIISRLAKSHQTKRRFFSIPLSCLFFFFFFTFYSLLRFTFNEPIRKLSLFRCTSVLSCRIYSYSSLQRICVAF